MFWQVPLLICTGVSVQLLAQHLTAHGLADRSTHLIPWLRYLSTAVAVVVGAALPSDRAGAGRGEPDRSKKIDEPRRSDGGSDSVRDGKGASAKRSGRGQPSARSGAGGPPRLTKTHRRYLVALGVAETLAYVSYSVGFAHLGAAASSIMLAGSSQTLTALSARVFLGRKLSRGQLLALGVILSGVALRASALVGGPGSGSGGGGFGSVRSGAPLPGPVPGTSALVGSLLVLLSGCAYASLGVLFDGLLSSPGGREVPYREVAKHISLVGLLFTSAVQVTYTIPNRASLVRIPADPSARLSAALSALAFALGINLHMITQSAVQRGFGATAVKVVSATASAALTLSSHAAFCSPEAPGACATPRTALAAALTLAGAALFARATSLAAKDRAAPLLSDPIEPPEGVAGAGASGGDAGRAERPVAGGDGGRASGAELRLRRPVVR